jgi:hypothetical protein
MTLFAVDENGVEVSMDFPLRWVACETCSGAGCMDCGGSGGRRELDEEAFTPKQNAWIEDVAARSDGRDVAVEAIEDESN